MGLDTAIDMARIVARGLVWPRAATPANMLSAALAAEEPSFVG